MPPRFWCDLTRILALLAILAILAMKSDRKTSNYGIVHQRSNNPDGVVVPSRVNPIGEEDHVKIPLPIDPQ